MADQYQQYPQPQTTQYPTTWNVDPSHTVANTITGLLASNNPYITNARAQGTQGAASRGFLNGTMAAGAAENAAVGAALPIAAQDASTYAHAGEVNATNATQQDIERMRAAATTTSAATAAGAARYGDDRRYATSQNALTQQGNEYNANWQHDQAAHGWSVQDMNRAEQYATRNAITGTMLGVFANDPSSFAASADGGRGFNDFYNSNFSSLFGSNPTNASQTDTALPDGYGNIPVPPPYRP